MWACSSVLAYMIVCLPVIICPCAAHGVLARCMTSERQGPETRSDRGPADFPDAQRANMWVQHLSDRDDTADEALSEFTVSEFTVSTICRNRLPARTAAMRRQVTAGTWGAMLISACRCRCFGLSLSDCFMLCSAFRPGCGETGQWG